MGLTPVRYSFLKFFRCLSPLLLLLFFVSCNSELATLTPIRNTPVRIETANAGTFTRMMIYATRTDGSFAFARLFNTLPVIEEEVPIGDYRFYGMTFNGAASELCSKASASLSGLSNQVTLSFDEATCADEVFLGSDPALNLAVSPAVLFPFSSVELCDSVANITTGTDECTDNLDAAARKHSRGHAVGMKVTLMTFEKRRGQTTATTGITAGCQNAATPGLAIRGLLATSVGNFYPAGDGSTTPFLIRFEFYPNDVTCTTGTPHVVDLQNGLMVNNSSAKQTITGGGRKLYFKLGPEEICKGDNLLTTFAGGSGGPTSPRLICNEAQLYNIFPGNSSYSDYNDRALDSYKLMGNIDLSDNLLTGSGFSPEWESCTGAGANFMPIGIIWDGTSCLTAVVSSIQFDGNGHYIKGLKLRGTSLGTGFYKRLQYSGGNDSEIRRLTLIDADISGTTHIGAIAGTSSRTIFRDIKIQDGVLYSPIANFVGGLSGLSEGDTVQIVNVSDISITAQNQVGGVFGQTTNAVGITTTIFDAHVSGSIDAGNYVGGIAGNMGAGSAGFLSTIKRSRFIGDIRSGQYTGGIIGQGVTTNIDNSYVNADFVITVGGLVRFGGIVGNMLSNTHVFPSGVESSYVRGGLVFTCTNNPKSNCLMGNVIGSHDNTFTAANFNTTVYSDTEELLLHNVVGIRGTAQPDTSFMSASPAWASTDFLLTIWQFSLTDYPRLIGEPQ